MGLLDRINRVVRANVNSLVSGAEDPEKILEQAVSDMQEELIRIRQAVAQAIATQKRTERQQAQATSTAEEWYRRAQLALQKNDEGLARDALTRRQSYADTAKAMQAQLVQQNEVVTQLKQNMVKLESKLAEAKSKKDLYIARARSAKASQQMHDLLGQVGSSGALSAFERMEDKVMQLEAQSEAIAELGTDDLEKQFAALEGGSEIDAQLTAMKSQMLEGNSAAANLPPSQAHSTQSNSASTNPVDNELEQLRSQMRDQ